MTVPAILFEPHALLSPGRLAQLACLIEATARKPGNVHRERDFQDLTYSELILAAKAIAVPLDRASAHSLGQSVLAAIQATRQVVRGNPNLGMVLLLVPLAAVPPAAPLRQGIRPILRATTLTDAAHVYEAIRLAQPGGLGQVRDQDVAASPTATLTEVMALASARDLVARQYATDFLDLFELALPTLEAALAEGRSLETAVIACHLAILAERPDTLIARRFGPELAIHVTQAARDLLAAGWPDQPGSHERLLAFDRWLFDPAGAAAQGSGPNRRVNPGATADLVAAALFAALRDGKIKLPLDRHDFEQPR